ncbi:MAG: penicillin-binding protein 1C [Marinoscillum sp.]|uniref:penicillin-binding protein 1C n=1 Tax=Marinoscillum sp. TaxID=2024838 RepID=UPI0032F888C5
MLSGSGDRRSKLKWAIGLSPLLVLVIYLAIPPSLGDRPTSTVLNDRDGHLLSASIAADGQWRFPLCDSVPGKLERCILLFEDEYFYSHPGINPFSVLRAIRQNVKQQRIVSGASTLTMQLARMLQNRERTLLQKLLEMGIALRMEVWYSKEELLRHYTSLAPFGGNVVGIDAASWRYYGRPAHLLSWSESATLAVLPNQPGAIYPGTSMEALRHKRDFLLKKLYQSSEIDSLTYVLSLEEPLPDKPFDIPQQAPHLLTTIRENAEGHTLNTTIHPFWQQKTTEVAERKHRWLKSNGIDNLAVIVVDLQNGKVLSYVGNTSDPTADGYQVDVIQKPRSSGSILKPLLYARSLEKGIILPKTLLPDVPSFFGGYTPKNFNLGYAGMAKANEALSMSLNIPFTHLLQEYTYEAFHQDLQKFGITTLSQPPGHYGLSIILGGAEVKLWDLAQVYFSLYRKLANEDNYQISFLPDAEKIPDVELSEINVWHTFRAMTELTRPGADHSWQNFSSSQLIAWKTGTSFGFRDAWAIGLNGNILVGVWVGNADGEGRAGLSGASSAGPILTELIRLGDYDNQWLEKLKPFSFPHQTCTASGMLAGPACKHTENMDLGPEAERSGLCTYHQHLWMDESLTYTVNHSCYDMRKASQQSVFVLPPKQGYYYQKNHSDYSGRPPVFPGCEQGAEEVLAINYPSANAKIFIPKELQGQSGEVILEGSHQNPNAELFWHLNDQYLGSTHGEHKQSLLLPQGQYLITILDAQGNATSRSFEVVSDPSS